DALGQEADFHDRPRRPRFEANHAYGKQRAARLGAVARSKDRKVRTERTATMNRTLMAVAVACVLTTAACGKKKPPVARPTPPPPTTNTGDPGGRPPAPPQPVEEPIRVPAEPVPTDAISSASLDDLNRNSPLKPVFFELDSSDLSREGQRALDENAATLKRYGSWTVTIEGHCDERGTAEYNLALGERRAT